jgi:hypothetical protein
LRSKKKPRWVEVLNEDWITRRDALLATFQSLGFENANEVKPTQLLGRLLGVPLGASNALVKLFEASCEHAAIDAAQSLARRDDPVQDIEITGQSVRRVDTTCLDLGPSPQVVFALEIDAGVQYAEVVRRKATIEDTGAKTFFAYRDDFNKLRGRRRFHVLVTVPTSSQRVSAIRPSGTTSSYFIDDLLENYTKFATDANASDLEKSWDAEFELTNSECTHGCAEHTKCTVGTRRVTRFVAKMPGALDLMASGTGSNEVSIVRVKEDGDRFVGALMSRAAARDAIKAAKEFSDRKPVQVVHTQPLAQPQPIKKRKKCVVESESDAESSCESDDSLIFRTRRKLRAERERVMERGKRICGAGQDEEGEGGGGE